ncbi:hypothetical protein ABPG75_003510, partial [Micractinium tetrahymenae]
MPGYSWGSAAGGVQSEGLVARAERELGPLLGGQPERPAQDCQAKREGLRRQLAEAEQSAAAQAATLEEVRAQLAARCDHLTFQEEAGEQLAPAGQAGEGRHLVRSTENVADLSMTLLLHALMEGRQDNCQVTDPLAEKLWATEATEVSLRRQLETPNMGAAAEIVGLRKTAQAFGMQSRLTLLQIKNQDLEEEMERFKEQVAPLSAGLAALTKQNELLTSEGRSWLKDKMALIVRAARAEAELAAASQEMEGRRQASADPTQAVDPIDAEAVLGMLKAAENFRQ